MEIKEKEIQDSPGGILFIVATPIGDNRDITLRALDVLNLVDRVICEGFRQGSTLLKRLDIKNKPLVILDEHNESNQTEEIVEFLSQGEQLALISDCGTPAFQDPGSHLIARCIDLDIPVKSIPGPSSLMAALSLSPIPLNEFYFIGFLPQKSAHREKKFQFIKSLRCPVVLMDTPYRLVKLLTEVRDYLGGNRLITLAVDLTLPSEDLFYGRVKNILERVKDRKAEFILIVY